MRWFCLSLLIGVLSLAAVVSTSWPSAAQNKQLTSFELGLLAEHNNVRQKNNLKPLVWDDTLAATAQEWAKKIAADGVEPPAHREGSAYGENISSGRVGALDPRAVLAKWESSQIVSSTTTRVGCGKARSADGQTDFLVCNYNPPSNQVGQATPTPRPVARQITSGATSSVKIADNESPRPVDRTLTAISTPASTSNTKTECEELSKNEQQLTARVEQLRKQVGDFDLELGEAAKKTAAKTIEERARAKEVARKIEERARAKEVARKECPLNKYGIEFMKIPAGRFMMGGARQNEKPVHEVTIRSFCMGQYEVTKAQWQRVIYGDGRDWDRGNRPVEESWDDAQGFIAKLNELNDGFRYRLPTEAEWEYAARAGTTGDYAGNLNEIAWNLDNSGHETHPVGGKQPNAWFLYDMIGNVWEWCEDVYHNTYDGAPTDGSAWLNGGDPKRRVLRGWSYYSHMTYDFRVDSVTYRVGPFGKEAWLYPGFRVVAVPR